MSPDEAETARCVARGFLGVALAGGREKRSKTEARDAERHWAKKDAGFRIATRADESGRLFRAIEFTGENLRGLLDAARGGDVNAHEALTEIAADMTDRDERLPLSLQKYIARDVPVFKKTRGRGRPRRGDWIRYAALAGAVAALHDVNGYNLTKNRSNIGTESNPSSCSIVAEIARERGMHETETAIEKIYERYRGRAAKLFFKGGVLPQKSDN